MSFWFSDFATSFWRLPSHCFITERVKYQENGPFGSRHRFRGTGFGIGSCVNVVFTNYHSYSVTVTSLLESRLMWCLAILLASTQPKLPWKMFGFWELADNLISLVISLWKCTWNPERSESSCRNKTLQRWKRSKLNTVSLTSVAPAWKWFVSASWDVKTSSSCCSSNKGYKI